MPPFPESKKRANGCAGHGPRVADRPPEDAPWTIGVPFERAPRRRRDVLARRARRDGFAGRCGREAQMPLTARARMKENAWWEFLPPCGESPADGPAPAGVHDADALRTCRDTVRRSHPRIRAARVLFPFTAAITCVDVAMLQLGGGDELRRVVPLEARDDVSAPRHRLGQVFEPEVVEPGQRHRALDAVLELAHVAGPRYSSSVRRRRA